MKKAKLAVKTQHATRPRSPFTAISPFPRIEADNLHQFRRQGDALDGLRSLTAGSIKDFESRGPDAVGKGRLARGRPFAGYYGLVEGAGFAGGVAGASPAGGADGAIGDSAGGVAGVSAAGGAAGADCSVAGFSTLTLVSPLWPYMK